MEIQLTETVDCCKIEYLITKFYSKSKAKKIESVKFNAQNLEFIDAWSAVILLVWQSSLVKLGKKVEFIAPDKSYIRKFFVNNNFEKCINRISVNYIGYKYGDYNLEQIKAEYDDILPFMVFNKKHSFEDYYSKLKSNNYYLNTFDKIKSEKFVKDGDLRNIFIKELGFNFIEHAESNSSFLGMMKYTAKNIESSQRRLYKVAPWMVNFYRSVGYNPTIELIVADDGLGLVNKRLINEYIKNISNEYDEKDIINYAFFYESTTKSQDERIGIISESIKSDKLMEELINYTIATGLYYVKELARSLKSFLMIRSGKTLCYFDFFNYENPDIKIPDLNKCKIDGYAKKIKLAGFPGLQYRFVVPMIKQIQKKFDLSKIYDEKRKKERIYDPIFVDLSEYISTPKIDIKDESSAIESILNLSNELRVLIKKNPDEIGQPAKIIILDVSDVSMNERMWQFFYSTIICLPFQQKDNLLCLTGVNNGKYDQVALKSLKKLKTKGYLRKTTPILCFDNEFEPSVIGCINNKEEEIIINSLKENKKIVMNDIEPDFIRSLKNSSLFETFIEYTEFESECFYPRTTFAIIKSDYNKILKRKISDYIINPDNNILYQGEYYLLSGKYYTRKFFNLRRFYEHSISKLFVNLLVDQILSTNPEVIITLGTYLSQLVDNAIDETKKINYLKFRNLKNISIEIMAYKNKASWSEEYAKTYNANRNAKTIIVTDIVCSGETLSYNYLKYCKKYDVMKIIAIIDARGTHRKEEIQLNSNVVGEEISFPFYFIHTDKIERFRKYPVGPEIKIRRVDLKTGNIAKRFKIRTPIEGFYNNELSTTGAVINGHFGNEYVHYCYFLKMFPLLQSFCSKYVNELLNDFKKQIDYWYYDKPEDEKIEAEFNVIVAYPEDSPGIELLIDKIIEGNLSWHKLPINRNKIESQVFEFRKQIKTNYIFLLIDTATSTGTTLSNILHSLTSAVSSFREPSHFYVSSIVSRLKNVTSEKFENINEYNGQHIKISFLRYFSLPVHSPYSCPICLKKKEVEKALGAIKKHENLFVYLEKNLIIFDLISTEYATSPDSVEESYASPSSMRRTEYRFFAEIAVTDPTENSIKCRKKLRDIAISYNKNKTEKAKENFLDLLAMIDNERFGMFLEQKVFNEVFYEDTLIEVIKACKLLLSQIQIDDDIKKAIWPLSKIIPDLFWQDFSELINLFKDNNKATRILIIEAILTVLNNAEFPVSEAELKNTLNSISKNKHSELRKALIDLHSWAGDRYKYPGINKTTIVLKKLYNNITASTNWRNFLVSDKPDWTDRNEHGWSEWLFQMEMLNIIEEYRTIYESPLGEVIVTNNIQRLKSPQYLRWLINNMNENIRSLRTKSIDRTGKQIIEKVLDKNWGILQKWRDNLKIALEEKCTCSLGEQIEIVYKDFIRNNLNNYIINWTQPTRDTAIIGQAFHVKQILICLLENIKRAYPNASKHNPGNATIDIKENNERKIILKIIDCGEAYTGQIGIGLSNVIKNCRKSLATPIFPKRNTKTGEIKEFTIEFHKWD